jgi:hypothetical protein
MSYYTHFVMILKTPLDFTKKIPSSISSSVYLDVFLLIFLPIRYLVYDLTFSL